MKFLFPKQPAFFNRYKELSGHIIEIADLFCEFAKEFTDAEKYYLKAEEIEHRADSITCGIVNDLNSTFIAPFDREDMYSLAYKMDDIVDLIENAIHNIYLYDIKEKDESIDEFSKLILEACHNLEKLIAECFKNKTDGKRIEIWMDRIHHLEDQGDVVFKKALTRIFSKTQDPIEVIKWKDIIEDLEEVIDQFKKVSGAIVRVMVKSN